MADPMLLDGWLQFNEEHWGLSAQRLVLSPEKGKSWELQTVLYTNRKGIIVQPPRNPYLPIQFATSATRVSAINRRKRDAFEALVKAMESYRGQRPIALDPVVQDVRPFVWEGQVARPRYTYTLPLPGWSEQADKTVFQKARKAEKGGYTVEQTFDYEAVQGCLESAQDRKGFDHRVSARGLARLAELMGGEHFVCFLARGADGTPKGAWVRIYVPGGRALAWSAGVQTEALKDGVNSLLAVHALEWFESRDCTSFDFVGANIPGVAAMKETWGGELTPYYVVSPRSLRYLALEAREMVHGWWGSFRKAR
ncbi:GNAT family N-acetyltransferase [Thioalkalivibrio sp. ALE12]|uniref:GNAT family N-acetyltransferase n=1 Tax=Thioalkalivibrio sp. ALE12 TaxID=1158170 RepID=UPI000366F725|nr:GNAT family N-acetyltransferase [Thioalkalivibrio sp. ALE12]